MAETLRVCLVHALRERQVVLELDVAAGTTAGQALALARDHAVWPPLPAGHRLAIFGRLVTADRVLGSGDRIEVLRPLVNDPKEIRRRRAAALGTSGPSARRR